jgi:hypothetical protein
MLEYLGISDGTVIKEYLPVQLERRAEKSGEDHRGFAETHPEEERGWT